MGETRRPDRLLEGEDPKSLVPKDARHWIAVYREMITFKDDLLARIRAQLSSLPVSARQDVLDNDVALIEEQLRRYQRRLEYWFARQWELEGLQIDYENRIISSRLPEESLRTYIGKVRAKLARLKVGAEIKNRPREGYALIFDNQKKPPAF